MGDEIVIKVQCGSKVAFSSVKTIPESGRGSPAALATSLREVQVQVNQALTELVENSDSQGSNQGQTVETSDDEDEDEEDLKTIATVKCADAKRKINDSCLSSSTVSAISEKRIKSGEEQPYHSFLHFIYSS